MAGRGVIFDEASAKRIAQAVRKLETEVRELKGDTRRGGGSYQRPNVWASRITGVSLDATGNATYSAAADTAPTTITASNATPADRIFPANVVHYVPKVIGDRCELRVLTSGTVELLAHEQVETTECGGGGALAGDDMMAFIWMEY